MKNSIEEDIKIINNFITYFNKNIQNGNKADLTVLGEEINALEHILSDYKRVLKENEELKSDNLEYQRIQDIFDKRTYRKKYLEERRKEEPNLLYPDVDEIYRRYYELRKENEELKNQEATRRKINELLVQRYSNSIPIQKVKDEIEKYKNMLKTCNKAQDIDRIKAINQRILGL